MPQRFAELTFTPAVRAAQQRYGATAVGDRLLAATETHTRLGPDEIQFLAERDSFHLATVGSNGWPYVQYRGGRHGFLHVLDDHTIAWADFRGNRQYISTGNLDPTGTARVAMILMDLANPSRMKLLGQARIVEAADDPEIIQRLTMDGYEGKVERAVVITLEAVTWNCPKHIIRRFTQAEIAIAIRPLQAELAELRAELARLRGGREQAGG